MTKIEQWSEQLALGGKSWVVRHEAEAKLRALEAKVVELEEDAAMLNWLDAAVHAGVLLEIAETMSRVWHGDLRGFVREAMENGYANVQGGA